MTKTRETSTTSGVLSPRTAARRAPRGESTPPSPRDPPPSSRLAVSIDHLLDADLREMYVRMVCSRHYLPTDVLDVDDFFNLVEFYGRDSTMRHIGEVCRGRLGIEP